MALTLRPSLAERLIEEARQVEEEREKEEERLQKVRDARLRTIVKNIQVDFKRRLGNLLGEKYLGTIFYRRANRWHPDEDHQHVLYTPLEGAGHNAVLYSTYYGETVVTKGCMAPIHLGVVCPACKGIHGLGDFDSRTDLAARLLHGFPAEASGDCKYHC
jgi:hypothetical protein